MKSLLPAIFIIFFSLTFSHKGYNQPYFPEDMVNVTGQMVDSSTGENLANVQVLNFRIHGGTMSGRDGKFSVQADPSDTLTFKLLGYMPKKIPVKDLITGKEYPKIPLTVIVYPIDEVQVEGTQRKMNLSGIPRGKGNPIPQELRSEDFATKPTILTAVFRPLAFLHYKLSKSEKEKRATLAAIYSERDWEILSVVYNKEVIQKITSLTGDELDDFMVYCNAYSGFKANATTYEVQKKIKDLFIEYKKTHPLKNPK